MAEALRSIDDAYVAVYAYAPSNPATPYAIYCRRDCDARRHTGHTQLEVLAFGRGYWVYIDRPVTLYLKGGN